MPQINGNEDMDTAEKIHMPEISRIPELDLIKAVCICGMVFIHIYEQMILGRRRVHCSAHLFRLV